MQSGREVAHPVPTMALSKPSLAATMYMSSCGWRHPPPLVPTLSPDAEPARKRAVSIFSAQCAVWCNQKCLLGFNGLSAQSSFLSGFMISKVHIVAQKPYRRQLNTKVCSSKSAISVILVTITMFNTDNSKTVEVLTIILKWNWYLPQHGALQPLSVFLFSIYPDQ